jgi:hypothetical protein
LTLALYKPENPPRGENPGKPSGSLLALSMNAGKLDETGRTAEDLLEQFPARARLRRGRFGAVALVVDGIMFVGFGFGCRQEGQPPLPLPPVFQVCSYAGNVGRPKRFCYSRKPAAGDRGKYLDLPMPRHRRSPGRSWFSEKACGIPIQKQRAVTLAAEE